MLRWSTEAGRRGFSLIEMLVVIGVIAVLVSIILPALAGARRAGLQTKSLANLRSISQVVELYVGEYDVYPFMDDGQYRVTPYEQLPTAGIGVPWMQKRWWPLVMHDVAPWPEHYASWMSPSRTYEEEHPWTRDPDAAFSTETLPSYEYSNSFIASPACWSTSGEAAVHVIAPSRVRSPAGKVIFFDGDRTYLRNPSRPGQPRPVLAADGSGSLRKDEDATAPVQNRLNEARPHVYHDTPDGVLGVDL